MEFIRQTYRVVEITDASEYLALSDNNKDAYRIIVSCGLVDLSEDSVSKQKLWAMFGEGTTTRAGLDGLLKPPHVPNPE